VCYGVALYLPKSVSLFIAMSICVRSVELRESSSAMREFCLFVSLCSAVQCSVVGYSSKSNSMRRKKEERACQHIENNRT
jgi:hypothetical protein